MPKHILVVDDSEFCARFAALVLSSAGYEVDVVHGAHDALGKAQQQCYDLIVTDRNMPCMSGDELLEALRVQPNSRRIPVLLMTADYDGNDEKRDSKGKHHPDAYIGKPFAPGILLKCVQQIMSQSGLHHSC